VADQSLPPIAAPTTEVYSQRENPAFEAALAKRTADQEAAFFLPYLRPGLRLLDVGCGPGAITLGLAELVQPGEVVGVDVQTSQVEDARRLAAERGVGNARFEVADVYRLPFPDGSFDAVFAHAVLMHLREPVRALQEMHRVLRPGGIAGLRDPDWGAELFFPETPVVEQFRALRVRVRQENGSDPYFGRQQRRCLLEAGFARAEATASVGSAGSLDETRGRAPWYKAQLQGFGRTAIAAGWIDQATVDAMAEAIDAWSERPDAFSVGVWCEAIGWVGETEP
jgi:SAM-dependent methyltransferase